ncbi:Casein kinase II subunit beta [Entamoeba marina]
MQKKLQLFYLYTFMPYISDYKDLLHLAMVCKKTYEVIKTMRLCVLKQPIRSNTFELISNIETMICDLKNLSDSYKIVCSNQINLYLTIQTKEDFQLLEQLEPISNNIISLKIGSKCISEEYLEPFVILLNDCDSLKHISIDSFILIALYCRQENMLEKIFQRNYQWRIYLTDSITLNQISQLIGILKLITSKHTIILCFGNISTKLLPVLFNNIKTLQIKCITYSLSPIEFINESTIVFDSRSTLAQTYSIEPTTQLIPLLDKINTKYLPQFRFISPNSKTPLPLQIQELELDGVLPSMISQLTHLNDLHHLIQPINQNTINYDACKYLTTLTISSQYSFENHIQFVFPLSLITLKISRILNDQQQVFLYRNYQNFYI